MSIIAQSEMGNYPLFVRSYDVDRINQELLAIREFLAVYDLHHTFPPFPEMHQTHEEIIQNIRDILFELFDAVKYMHKYPHNNWFVSTPDGSAVAYPKLYIRTVLVATVFRIIRYTLQFMYPNKHIMHVLNKKAEEILVCGFDLRDLLMMEKDPTNEDVIALISPIMEIDEFAPC